MSTYDLLASIRDAMAAVPGVKTCKIGYEADLTPDDYPIVRIVPSSIKDGIPRGAAEEVAALIYFGMPIHEFSDAETGLEGVYSKMLPYRRLLLDAGRAATAVGSLVHDETLLDEDKIAGYKLFAMKVRIVG